MKNKLHKYKKYTYIVFAVAALAVVVSVATFLPGTKYQGLFPGGADQGTNHENIYGPLAVTCSGGMWSDPNVNVEPGIPVSWIATPTGHKNRTVHYQWSGNAIQSLDTRTIHVNYPIENYFKVMKATVTATITNSGKTETATSNCSFNLDGHLDLIAHMSLPIGAQFEAVCGGQKTGADMITWNSQITKMVDANNNPVSPNSLKYNWVFYDGKQAVGNPATHLFPPSVPYKAFVQILADMGSQYPWITSAECGVIKTITPPFSSGRQ